MGIFDFFNNVSGYSNSYDYCMSAILKCTKRIFKDNVGELRLMKTGDDWMFVGGTPQVLAGTQVLDNLYYDEMEGYFNNKESIDVCVDEICKKIDVEYFLRKCDEFSNRNYIDNF